MTARFALLMMVSVFNGFNVRVDDLRLFRNMNKNPLFLICALIIIVAVIAIVNFGGDVFHVAKLTWTQWGIVIALAALVVPLDLLRKILMQRNK
jgi:magnesium-transporting ATPase (P-type)